ncbi:hypothetical protein [Dongia rigui]|uniref:Uncharacterized protein n=1 Tax=Dongia rigui TaxID=940149 RepID=A0ABU5DXZ3_9PROT|nr:hypothetical protein [Dongia rigui]MDY0872183.1 hypothetical protein [Dongia rigui]
MSDSWDMSFLIDQATRIHEARGNFGKHLGKPLRGLVDDHLVNFVAQEDRLLFLRFMAKLLLQTGTTTATARIHTPIIGEKIFELDARNGIRAKTWWLMLSASNSRGYAPLASIVDTDPVASGAEFGQLARNAAKQGSGKLGMTLFQSKAVSERSFGKMTQERRDALDKRIGEVLVEATDTGIVTKPDIGQYAVLHGADVSPQQISERIVQAASEMEITEKDLGLTQTTETLAENVEADDVGRMIRNMREKLVDRATREPIPDRVEWGKHPTFLQKMMSKVKK